MSQPTSTTASCKAPPQEEKQTPSPPAVAPPPAAASPPTVRAAPPAAPAPAVAVLPEVAKVRQHLANTAVGEYEAERFLESRGGNAAKAARLAAAYAEWRRAEDIDGILEEPPLRPAEREDALVRSYDPLVLDGCDLQGRPVVYTAVGRIEIDELTRLGVGAKVVLRRHVRALERVQQLLAARGPPRDAEGAAAPAPAPRSKGYLFVVDVKDGTATRFLAAWKLWSLIGKCDAKYYPGLLGAVCVVRAPSVANWALGVCKRSFLDGPTCEKITLDTNENAVPVLKTMLPPELLAQLPADVLDPPPESASEP